MITTWEREIANALLFTKESREDLITHASTEELNHEWRQGQDGDDVSPIVIWGKKYVYFSLRYDNLIDLDFVSISPDAPRFVRHVGHWPYNYDTV